MTVESNSRVIPQNDRFEERSLGETLDLLHRRRRVIITAALVGLLPAIYLGTRPRNYEAVGEVRVQPGMQSMFRTSPMELLSGNAEDKIASEARILQGRPLYVQVARELNLTNDPSFWGRKVPPNQSIEDPQTRDRVVRELNDRIKIEHDPKDEIIQISCKTISPNLSARIVDTLINDYVAYLFQIRYGATKRSSGWIISQLDDLKQQIERDQQALTELQSRLGVIGLDEKGNYLAVTSLEALTKAASEGTLTRIVAEAKYRFLSEADPELIEGGAGILTRAEANQQTSLIQSLRREQAEASSTYSRLRALDGAKNPEVVQQRAQLDEINAEVKKEEQRILKQAQLDYDAAAANEHMTSQALSEERSKLFKGQNDMVRYEILLRDYQAHRTLYEGLVAKLREADITSGMEAGEIDIVALADLPGLPAPPNPFLMSSGVLLGFVFLGCLLAIGFEALDRRITTQEQAERISRLPLLSILPHMDPKDSGDTITAQTLEVVARPRSLYAEAVRSLRSAILLARPGAKPTVLVLTSAMANEGKSITSLNLATIFAQYGSRVLLVDCDLRMGKMARRLGLNAKIGLSTVLAGAASFDEARQSFPDLPNLTVVTSGDRPPDASVLLSSKEMAHLVERWRSEYDTVLLDCPPLLGLSDVLNLGVCADGVILVVRNLMSTTRAVMEAEKLALKVHLPVIGFILNDIDPREQGYGYGYGYTEYRSSYFEER